MRSDLERRRHFEAVAEQVYEPLQRYLRRRLSHADAEEVFGDVLLAVWRRIDDVPDGAVLPWCYGVARHAVANRRRSQRRQRGLLERLASTTDRAAEPPIVDDHPELRAALGKLSAAEQEVVRLWAWEDLEPREIAIVLDTTANAVSLRLTRAKAKLAREIARQNPAGGGQKPDESTEEHRS